MATTNLKKYARPSDVPTCSSGYGNTWETALDTALGTIRRKVTLDGDGTELTVEFTHEYEGEKGPTTFGHEATLRVRTREYFGKTDLAEPKVEISQGSIGATGALTSAIRALLYSLASLEGQHIADDARRQRRVSEAAQAAEGELVFLTLKGSRFKHGQVVGVDHGGEVLHLELADGDEEEVDLSLVEGLEVVDA